MSAKYFWREALLRGSQLVAPSDYGVRGSWPWYTAIRRSVLVNEYWRYCEKWMGRGPNDAELYAFGTELWLHVGINRIRKYPTDVAVFTQGTWVQTRKYKNHKLFDTYEWHVRHYIDRQFDPVLTLKYRHLLAARKEDLTRFK